MEGGIIKDSPNGLEKEGKRGEEDKGEGGEIQLQLLSILYQVYKTIMVDYQSWLKGGGSRRREGRVEYNRKV